MSKNSLKSTLNSYLKQKNYPIHERFRKSDLVLAQSKEDFLMDLKIKSEISRTNSFTFSNISSLNGSQTLVDQQVCKLLKFIQCQRNFTVRSELEMLLPPIVCHLFIEMLKGKDWKPAHEFLRKYSSLVGNFHEMPVQKINGSDANLMNPQQIVFIPHAVNCSSSSKFLPSTSKRQPPSLSQLTSVEEQKLNMFRELISNLSCIRRLEDVKDNKLIFSFRSCKYKAKLANRTLTILNRYLSKHGHVLLIQILHLWFSIDLYDLHDDQYNDEEDSSSSSSSSEHNVHNLDINRKRNSRSDRFSNDSLNCDTQKDIRYVANNSRYNYERPTTANQCDDASTNFFGNCNSSGSSNNFKLKRLRECLHRINSKFHKPVRIFNINYTENSLCSASVDKQLCHLAAGFEDSNIILWSINGFENYGHKPFNSFERRCQWSINNCNRMLTDDISDYETSDEEVERSLREASVEENCSSNENFPKTRRKRKYCDKNQQSIRIKESWREYASKSCSENIYSTDSQSIILRGHRGSITDVFFGRKDDILLSTSRDKTFRLWKADSYTCASVYRGHEFPIWCIDENPNGCYAVTGSRDTTARLWSYERKFPLKIYPGHTQDVDCIAFHPNGNYFATGSSDTTIRMWCVTTGKLLRIFTECHLPVNSISFSPDGKFLAAAGDESKIRIFDLAAGQQITDLKNHTASVKSLCWSSNSKKLLSGCSDGSFYVWNVNNLGLSTNNKDKSGSLPSSSKHHPPNTTNSSNPITLGNNSNSSSMTSLLQSNSSGCKRIVKVFFHGQEELVHAIGND